MSVRCRCPTCGKIWVFSDAAIGKKGRCKTCGTPFAIDPKLIWLFLSGDKKYGVNPAGEEVRCPPGAIDKCREDASFALGKSLRILAASLVWGIAIALISVIPLLLMKVAGARSAKLAVMALFGLLIVAPSVAVGGTALSVLIGLWRLTVLWAVPE